MKDLDRLTIIELAAVICDSLNKEGLKATLSGGACAEIYSSSKYVTGDLDFVVNYIWPENQKKIESVMEKLGFVHEGRIYVNPSLSYSVEFPPGPLSVGEDYRIKPIEKNLPNGRLFLLSPTDSVKDRLTGYIYGNDAQCLQQAVMICKMNSVDIESIRKWATNEDCPEKFQEFERLLSETKS